MKIFYLFIISIISFDSALNSIYDQFILNNGYSIEKKEEIAKNSAVNYDLSLTLTTNNNCPSAGELFSFTITLSNEGDSIVNDILVLDTLPFGTDYINHSPAVETYDNLTGIWDVGTIAPNSTKTLRINCTAKKSGYYLNQSEVVRTGVGEDDWDSIPNNGNNNEDDFDKVCFSVPAMLNCGESFTITAPNILANYSWLKDSVLINGANASTLTVTTIGNYIYTTDELSNIDCNNVLCPMKIIDGSCCTIVTNTNNFGPGSLAAAIECANTNPDLDTIIFNIPTTDPGINDPTPGNPGNGDEFWVINLMQPFYILTPIYIDGLKQPGSRCGAPRIMIDGKNLAEGSNIFNLFTGSNGSTIQGFSLVNAPNSAVQIRNAHKNHIRCNFIGLVVDGQTINGNGASGIIMDSLASVNIIGGTFLDKNIISGNTNHGILIDSTSSRNIISGNWIGIDVKGIHAKPNRQDGIHVKGFNNKIGGELLNDQNIISGNGDDGIEVNGIRASGNIIQINSIGTAVRY